MLKDITIKIMSPCVTLHPFPSDLATMDRWVTTYWKDSVFVHGLRTSRANPSLGSLFPPPMSGRDFYRRLGMAGVVTGIFCCMRDSIGFVLPEIPHLSIRDLEIM